MNMLRTEEAHKFIEFAQYLLLKKAVKNIFEIINIVD